MLRSETAAEPARTAAALRGLRAYQEAPRVPRPAAMPAVAERHGAALRDYGGRGPPVVFVPSLINPPHVLDLAADRSLLRWLAGRGRRVLLLDWGEQVAGRAALDVAGHVGDILVPLVRALDVPPALVGYCLGGTMAIGAAACMPVERLATIAAPWRFAGYTADARAKLAALWRGAGPLAERLGVLPMEVLQTAFWALDPGRSVAKFERFASLRDEPARAAFVALEDWANDGPPLPLPAARELFELFYAADATGTGAWLARPEALPCPQLHIVSTSDRIVPAASAPGGGERLELAQGHVGMVVGSAAEAMLWEPLARWLSPARAT